MWYNDDDKELIINNGADECFSKVEIVNISGTLLLVKRTIDIPIQRINLSQLPRGIYFVKLLKCNNENYVNRFIIQ